MMRTGHGASRTMRASSSPSGFAPPWPGNAQDQEVETGSPLHEGLAVAPGGDRVALLETSGLDGAIRILDLETGEILITIPLLASDTPGFSSGSAVLCWSADARTIVFLWPPEGLLEDVRLYTVPASGGTPILVTGGGTGEAGIFHISCAG